MANFLFTHPCEVCTQSPEQDKHANVNRPESRITTQLSQPRTPGGLPKVDDVFQFGWEVGLV